MSEYQLKPGKIGEKIIERYQKIEDKFTETFLEEDSSLKTGGMAQKVTAAYQKIEDTIVGGYQKIEDTFVDRFLEKSGEPSPDGQEPADQKN